MNDVIQWYPGHMARAMRRLGERLALIDVAIEVVDARLPRLSSNPDLDALLARKKRLLVLGREDLADAATTRAWIAAYREMGRETVAVDARDQRAVAHVKASLLALAGSQPARAMIVGIPNTGKSSVVNGLLGRAAAKTEDKAGVTRTLQWFRVGPRLELMDTPGILVPKIPTRDAQWMLAITGALPRERYDAEDVVGRLVAWARSGSDPAIRASLPDLETFAETRGFRRKGGEIDLHNAAGAYLKAFGDGAFGRISFEVPEARA